MKKTIIKNIVVSQVANFGMHSANNGEKTLGNQPSLKKLPTGDAYISGQMVKRAVMESYRSNIPLEKGEYISTPDVKSECDITNDIGADIRGYMLPDENLKRHSPLAVTVAQTINKSDIFLDLLLNFKKNQDNSIVNREISQSDNMLFNFSLDVERVGVSDDQFRISQSESIFERFYVSHLPENQRKKRVINVIKSFQYLNNFANQSRNAVNGSPFRVIIVLDEIHSRKAFDFWKKTDEKGRKVILDELNDRGIKYFIGDDLGEISKLSVYDAFKKALEYLEKECDLSQIFTGDIVDAITHKNHHISNANNLRVEMKAAKAKSKSSPTKKSEEAEATTTDSSKRKGRKPGSLKSKPKPAIKKPAKKTKAKRK